MAIVKKILKKSVVDPALKREIAPISSPQIQSLIYTVRSIPVMFDRDLAKMFGVETKVLNQAVKRNLDRFPDSFRFILTREEATQVALQKVEQKDNQRSRSQNVTLKEGTQKRGQNIKHLPYAFTEQGVAMLSAVLKSETAIRVSIQIIKAFVDLRKMVIGHAGLLQRIDKVEKKQLEADQKFELLFQALESKEEYPDKGIFFEGRVFDAYVFVARLIKSAKTSLVLIDNYVDETVLALLAKRNKKVKATIYTKQINRQLQLDLSKHNAQYPAIELKILDQTHDRFIIIDNKELYHLGASLKDLGKKWFAFSKMNSLTRELISKLK